MKTRFPRTVAGLRRPVLTLSIAAALGIALAAPAQAQVSVDVGVTAPEPGWLYDLGSVISVFVDAPVVEPEPIAVAWAPPPMLVEELPPQPSPDAVWTGGYWTWQGDWVWCAGRWMEPPRERYVWVQPYYEHREDRVIFIPGYWSDPDVEFIAPPVDRPVPWGFVSAGVVIGPPPEGPMGIFVPPPPGSRPGIIVPAPIGTPPAVVVSAPPVLAVGMRISGSVTIDARHTVVNDNRVTNYSVTNVRNVTNVTVVAPASATASHQAFQAQVPHLARLAAAQHPQVAARAPQPTSRTAVAAYVPGRTVAALPAPQKVQGLPAVPPHGAANVPQAQRAQMAHAPMTPDEARQAHAAAAGGKPGARDVDVEHLPATAAGPQGNRAPTPAPAAQQRGQQEQAQRAEQQRSQQEAQQQAQQREQQQAQQQRGQQEQAQRAEQQRSQQQAQQQAQQREQQQAQQEQAQRAEQQHSQQQAQQRAQEQQAQQRAEQQRAQQEQAQRAEQQRSRQEAQQQAQQRAQEQQAQRAEQQRAQQEQAQHAAPQRAEPPRAQPEHERAQPHREEASQPAR